MKSRYIYIIIGVNLAIVTSIIWLWMSWDKKLKKEVALNEIPVNRKPELKERITWALWIKIINRNGEKLGLVKIIFHQIPSVRNGYRKERKAHSMGGELICQSLQKKEKSFLSFYKKGYKPVKNVKFFL